MRVGEEKDPDVGRHPDYIDVSGFVREWTGTG
jgi:hypothetical protein